MIELKPIDINIESRLVGNLVMSTELLNNTYTILDASLFESNLSRIVVSWVLDFYKRTEQAPKKTIGDIFLQRRRELTEADAVLIQEYLKNASDNWVPNNLDYARDSVVAYMQERSLNRLVSQLQTKMSGKDVKGANSLIAEYTKPDTYIDKSLDILNDAEFISKSLNVKETELFTLDNDLGKVMGTFNRDDFVAFLAPPKRGKTWWLMYLALNSYLQGNNTLFISLEMTPEQMTRRFWQMISGQSRNGELVNSCRFVNTGSKECVDDLQIQTYRMEDNVDVIRNLQDKLKGPAEQFAELNGKSKPRLLLRNYPTGSLSLRDLKAELKNMEVFENFIPDTIVIDYADIMRTNSGNKDKRFALDDLWLGLRGLNLETHTCLITASQSGRATVTGEKDADESDIAEAVSKLNHVTKMITINQNKIDKKRGIYRLNCNTTRDGGVVYDTAVVISCLAIGRPYMDCRLLSNVEMPKDRVEDMPQESTFKPKGFSRS